MAKGIAAEVGYGHLCSLSRGVWGHAPPENFWNLSALRLILVQSEPKFSTLITIVGEQGGG